MYSKRVERLRCDDSANTNSGTTSFSKPLGVVHLLGCFGILAGGMVLGLAILTVEVVVKNWSKMRQLVVSAMLAP